MFHESVGIRALIEAVIPTLGDTQQSSNGVQNVVGAKAIQRGLESVGCGKDGMFEALFCRDLSDLFGQDGNAAH